MAQGSSRLNSAKDSIEVKQATAANLKIDLSGTASNTNPLIVDGSGTNQPVNIADGLGNNLTSHSAGAARGLDVSIVDGSGNQITSFGGGTQYAEGSTAATPTGTVAMWKDSGNAIKSVSSSTPLPITLANTGANATAIKVDGSAVTQPVSASSLPLPTGAATSAKQPTLGTAGTASTDVITVQGITSMTALKVDGSAVTQPVSRTSATDGSQKTQVVDGSGNVVTSHTAGSSKGLDVSIIDGSGNQITSFGGGTQYAEGANAPTSTGNVMMGKNGATVKAVGVSATGILQVDLSQTNGNSTAVKVDGSAVTQPASQSGTWTVQPGNTANTTPWLVTPNDGSSSISISTVEADATSNTANRLRVASANKVWNGSTWDRLPGDTTGIKVQSHNVTNAGTFATQSAQSGTWTVQPGNTANTTPWLVTPTPGTSGGWSKSKYAAQTTTVQTVKGTAGTFGGYFVYNPNASVAYIQVFDVASATTVTLGTTSPDMIFGIPATSGANLEITLGVNMANGIKLACTTTATGSTAPGSGLDLTIFYK